MSAKAKVAVLLSGRGSNFSALLSAAAQPDYPAEIVTCLSDVPTAPGLDKARAAGVPATAIARDAHQSRGSFETALHRALSAHAPDVICLAGFMRILSADFVARWEGRILNIHPSLLPVFRGLNTHARALKAGVKIHGATVHTVTAELDDGPIIAQAAVQVLPGDTEETLAARVLDVEHALYPAALARFLRVPANAPHTQETLFSPPLSQS
ncbi:MAG: phosphoribosylglycinamide formyltransferase [Pseudomonadota bacterium]